jgi:hypothetical protein
MLFSLIKYTGILYKYGIPVDLNASSHVKKTQFL